jgi:Zn-dependent protease with chaperone function/type II secretory pathway pseudopilin PulG
MSSVTAAVAGADAGSLVYPNEKRLFAIAVILSVLFWLALILGTFGVALIYVLLAFIFYVFVQSAFISYLQGTATKITAEQFPDLHQRIREACAKLGVDPVPDAYLLQGNGVFNAFATRFLGRNFIVLMSDVVDALESEPDAVSFYIGHELGHIRRSHLVWGPVLFPASILPLLGAAYSRAREYTCDMHGLACCASSAVAAKGLAALAAGGRRWKTLDAVKYANQSQSSGGFWMSFHELIASYPWLVKRMARILGKDQVAVPTRNFFAWVLAAFVPRVPVAGGASLLVTVAIIGILAAVAIPAYQDYTTRAKLSEALFDADRAGAALADYYYRTGKVPPNLGATGFAASSKWVTAITSSEKGAIRIELGFSPLQGKSFSLVPSLDSNKKIVWRCAAGDVEPRYLPQRCRQQ